MQIGDIVWRSDFGVGKIVCIVRGPAPYLVYFYKKNKELHNGNRGPDEHYWYCCKGTFTLTSTPLISLIERRRNVQDRNR